MSLDNFGFLVRTPITLSPPLIAKPSFAPGRGFKGLFSSTLTSLKVSKEALEIFISIEGRFEKIGFSFWTNHTSAFPFASNSVMKRSSSMSLAAQSFNLTMIPTSLKDFMPSIFTVTTLPKSSFPVNCTPVGEIGVSREFWSEFFHIQRFHPL